MKTVGTALMAREGHDRPQVGHEDIEGLRVPLTRLAAKMRYDLAPLRAWEQEDLVQEILLKALVRLETYKGTSSLKTWTISLARNHLLSMARSASLRPKPSGNLGGSISEDDTTTTVAVAKDDPVQTVTLREGMREMLAGLKAPPGQESHEWEMMTLLLRTHADWSYVALAMTIRTGEPWTVERVRQVTRKIRKTYGRELCAAAGIGTDTTNTRSDDHGR